MFFQYDNNELIDLLQTKHVCQKSDLATTIKVNKTNCHNLIMTDIQKIVKTKNKNRQNGGLIIFANLLDIYYANVACNRYKATFF